MFLDSIITKKQLSSSNDNPLGKVNVTTCDLLPTCRSTLLLFKHKLT